MAEKLKVVLAGHRGMERSIIVPIKDLRMATMLHTRFGLKEAKNAMDEMRLMGHVTVEVTRAELAALRKTDFVVKGAHAFDKDVSGTRELLTELGKRLRGLGAVESQEHFRALRRVFRNEGRRIERKRIREAQ